MNKEGFLLMDETVKIIIAVICLLFLVALFGIIYNVKNKAEEKRYAEDTLARIEEVINALKEDQSIVQDLINPKGWFLISFTGNEPKPNLCIEKDCLCICEMGLMLSNSVVKQAKNCDKLGVCTVVENLKAFSTFWLPAP